MRADFAIRPLSELVQGHFELLDAALVALKALPEVFQSVNGLGG